MTPYTSTPGVTELLEPCRPVDAIAQQFLARDCEVAKIEAAPEHDTSLGRYLRLPLGDALCTAPAHATASTAEPDIERRQLGCCPDHVSA